MKLPSSLKKWLVAGAIIVMPWLALNAFVYTKPVVVLHYSAAASAPVSFFINRDNDTFKGVLNPGENRVFHTPHSPSPDYFVEVSLPLASRDGIEIKPPFSRVDVYIDADTKIARTAISTDYLARYGFE